MSETKPVVFVVDDDLSVLKSLRRLLTVYGFRVETFSSAREFLGNYQGNVPGCLVLDIRLPQLDGLELQRILAERGAVLPIIFITGHGDIPMSVQAMKAGAVDFLPKPFNDQSLIEAIEFALDKSRSDNLEKLELADISKKLATLTPRESEVLKYVVSGKLNKEIAADLGIAEKTVKVHRGRVMQKMRARSVADLVLMAEKARIISI
ncbi:MAG: response regulator transcription factor [Nitrospirae bacterium]|nr:response regulator transcription factor [Nitrospirota bacterium]